MFAGSAPTLSCPRLPYLIPTLPYPCSHALSLHWPLAFGLWPPELSALATVPSIQVPSVMPSRVRDTTQGIGIGIEIERRSRNTGLLLEPLLLDPPSSSQRLLFRLSSCLCICRALLSSLSPRRDPPRVSSLSTVKTLDRTVAAFNASLTPLHSVQSSPDR